MITYIRGDIFSSPAQVLVNPVNTDGVMGKGLAKEFKRRYPEMFKQYQLLCERKQFAIGQLHLYKTPNRWILNFPTKQSWRNKSKPEYIEAGLKKFVDSYLDKSLFSVAFPQLGCGNGELDWESQVRPMFENYLQPLRVELYIYLFDNTIVPEHLDTKAVRRWLHFDPQMLPFNEFWQDLLDVLEQQQTFKRLDTDQPFEAVYKSDSKNVHFRHGEFQFTIPKEDGGFLDLWQYIRIADYSVASKLPAGLDQFGDYLIALLSQLSYIQVIRPSDVNDVTQIGIQLIDLPKQTMLRRNKPLLVQVPE